MTEQEIFDFLNRKYTQRSDTRQRDMGLQYMTAETHDLAREIAGFVIPQIIEQCAKIAENFYYWQGSCNLADTQTKEWIATAIRKLTE